MLDCAMAGISAYHPAGLTYLWNARPVQISAAPTANRLPGGTIAVIAYTQGIESSMGSTIATQATIASHPIERMIHVQTAACAAVRMLILAVLRSLTVRLIASPDRGKRKVVHTVFLFVTVADEHHWRAAFRTRGRAERVCSIIAGIGLSPERASQRGGTSREDVMRYAYRPRNPAESCKNSLAHQLGTREQHND
jgi:hypothetical protein